jgi:hypothetical protein
VVILQGCTISIGLITISQELLQCQDSHPPIGCHPNHLGTSDTFTAAEYSELVNGDPARPASGRDGESYSQLSPTSGGVDDRVVYTVAGSSGKADKDAGSLTTPEEWLRHAAHIEQPADTVAPKRNGLPLLGSVVVDATSNQLRASFINVDGEVLDSFTIER